MKNKFSTLLFIAILCFTTAGNPQVQRDIELNASVDSRCKIEISSNSLSFTRVRPDVERLISQNEPSVSVTIKTTTKPGEKVYLRIMAEDDLSDQRGHKIEVSNLSWKSSGQGFKNGKLNTHHPQKVGQWNKSGVWRGTLTFYLKNKKDYAPGVYNVRINLSVSSF